MWDQHESAYAFSMSSYSPKHEKKMTERLFWLIPYNFKNVSYNLKKSKPI